MKFLLPPENTAYAVEFGEESVRVQLDGGAGRYRKDVLNSSQMVECEWSCDQTEYDYAMAFYRTQTKRGSLPFTIDLIINEQALEEVTAYFVPGSFKLTGQRGLTYSIAATLEIVPVLNPTEEADDNATIAAYNASQGYSP